MPGEATACIALGGLRVARFGGGLAFGVWRFGQGANGVIFT